MKLGFGKFATTDIEEVPRDYLESILNYNNALSAKIKTELDRRDSLETSQLSMMQQIVRAGYKSMAGKLHPDNRDTGNAEEFKNLQDAMVQFKIVMEEVEKASAE